MNERIMIAMSGGVDSAVAALLASRERDAAGVTMRLRQDEDAANANGAATVCAALGLPHFVADLGEVFARCVVNTFIDEYQKGSTPNPCVDCNRTVKFGALLDFALSHGYSRLATGHYARVERNTDGRYLLRRATNHAKDQSYVLYSLTQEVLSRVEFPLGDLPDKETVRALARENGFPMASKRDSQDICFIPDGDYAAFIEHHIGDISPRGKFVNAAGEVLGEHQGIIHYTIGQRKGLGLACGHPVYVTAKSASDNTVTVGENADLFTTRVVARHINLIPFDTLSSPMKIGAKVRYRQEVAAARVEQTGADELTVEFNLPQRAVSPGQSLVLYDGDYVIGGGKIQS